SVRGAIAARRAKPSQRLGTPPQCGSAHPQLRDRWLYRIYFVDMRLYGAVTSPKFPVWLQDGKWPPEGKLSSSSISPRGFLFSAVGELGDLLCPGGTNP